MVEQGDESEGVIKPYVPKTIQFNAVTPGASLDISTLTDEQRKTLVMEYARGTLDVAKKAQEMHLDVSAFQQMLNVMSQNTKEIAETSGASVTMQHTHQSSVGRTEIIMGNTAQAAKGKLTRSISGDRDMTFWYIAMGVVAVVLVIFALVRH